MKAALGIKDDYKDGTSFNQELQAAHRAEEKAAKEAQRLEEEIAREQEKRKAEKQREKEEKAKSSKERHKKKRLVTASKFILIAFSCIHSGYWKRYSILEGANVILVFYLMTKSNIHRIVRNIILNTLLYSCRT